MKESEELGKNVPFSLSVLRYFFQEYRLTWYRQYNANISLECSYIDLKVMTSLLLKSAGLTTTTTNRPPPSTRRPQDAEYLYGFSMKDQPYYSQLFDV